MSEDFFPRLMHLQRRDHEIVPTVVDVTADELFGIHRSIDMNTFARHWTVTHVPTGCAITDGCFSRPEAIKVIEQLRLMPWDWNNDNPRTFNALLKQASPSVRAKMNDLIVGVC